MRRSLSGLTAMCVGLAIAGTASANSVTLAFSTTTANTVTASVSDSLVVLVYANYSNVQGFGNIATGVSVSMGPNLVETTCIKPSQQTIGSGATNATWGRIAGACGFPGGNYQVEQEIKNDLAKHSGSSTGTVLLGAITFHVGGAGLINSFFNTAADGFGLRSGATVFTASQDDLTVNVVPEPGAVALLATSVLGVLAFTRRWKA